MAGLALGEKMNGAMTRTAESTAEKHFYDQNAPKHCPLGFSITYRNPGHWDVFADAVPGRAAAWLVAHPGGVTSEQDGGRERAFRIRGELGKVTVMDERWNPHRPYPRESMTFRSVTAAMLWIAEELMQEPTP